MPPVQSAKSAPVIRGVFNCAHTHRDQVSALLLPACEFLTGFLELDFTDIEPSSDTRECQGHVNDYFFGLSHGLHCVATHANWHLGVVYGRASPCGPGFHVPCKIDEHGNEL